MTQNFSRNSTGKCIPKDTKEEDIANFIQAGDTLSCRVVKSLSLHSFSYVEEEEEIGEDGVEKRTSRTVEIKPQWIAISGETIANTTRDVPKGLRKEDVNVIEDQIEEMLDFEPEEEDEDLILIEDVKIDDDDTASVKDKPVKKPEKKKEEAKKPAAGENFEKYGHIS